MVSDPLIAELLDVLRRPQVNHKFRLLPNLDITRLLELLAQAQVVELEAIPRISRNVKDDKVLATAVAAGARYLVSEDQDLLVLGKYQGV